MEFEGKVALITGAAHGFGEAIATQAAAQKMKLALLDQDQEALGQVVKKLKQSTDVLEIVADVTEEEQVYAAVDKTMTAYGQIDLLVNDAGVAVPGPIWELPTRDWEWILHADLMSQVYALRKVIPIMMKQENGGDILNVASAAGLLTAPGMPAYYATKFAVVGMTEAVAYDLQAVKQDKIRMHVFTPAFVQTNLMHSEEYRPDKYRDESDPYYQSESFKLGQKMAVDDLTAGLPIDSVGATIFDGLKNNDFYILTHKGIAPMAINRVKDAVEGRAPSLTKLMTYPDKTHTDTSL
ncbi:hypothetical protein FC36_GL001934 [Ligilactobacillus equi DSM 15833 = JCM 10991]|uniref:Uncharacterized protein n=1 Tax=Ligilactobacillus equi DSM 15833 = JCM 10991 TaxID=1423740 RepID=A0A0R1T648_9LACO|nr:SDR family NAD(P)-dependent oxidoreductase [Ligilactobacillus equi]KRL76222.1 hypothetical protein FC36_GL001934 [Ligilactobacillus equi DSM 15833 = JCM 10991]